MRLEHESADQLKKDILRVLQKYLDLKKYKVFLFGSRVSGKGDQRSDVDIGIQGERPIAYDIWAKIVGEIEEIPVLYKLDLIDFARVSEQFKQVALSRIEPIS